MKVDYMVLADAAAAAEGKHYIHGAGWDTLWAGSFPVTHPQLSVALRIRIPWTATNQPHKIHLDVQDADGRSILPETGLTGELNFGRPPQLKPGEDQFACLVMNVIGLQFETPAHYAVVFSIDGSEEARTTFRVADLATMRR